MNKGVVFLLIKAVIILSFVGCSQSSAPSTSDVEEQLESILQKCENISIESVEKINGIPKDALTHIVKVKFTILSIPPLANKNIWESYKARKEAAEEEHQKMQEQKQALIREEIKIKDKLNSLPGNLHTDKQDKEYFQTVKEYDESKKKYKEFWKNEENIKIDSEYRSILDEEYNTRQKLVNNFRKECIYPRQKLARRIVGDIFEKYKNLGEEVEFEYTAEITMLKTDNGWMMEL